MSLVLPQTKASNQALNHTAIIQTYGLFMVAWSVIESVIQTAIMKQLGIDATRAVVITGKMQFNPRVQLLCGLLKLEGDKYEEAIKLLNKTEGFAHRNVLVHGNIIVGMPGQLTFVKYDGGNSAKRSFTFDDMHKHVTALTDRTNKLQSLLDVSDADMQKIVDATLAMAT